MRDCVRMPGCQGYRIHITGTVPPFNLSLPPYFCSVEQILVPAKRASVTIQGQKIGKSMTASVKSSRPSGRISRSKTMMMMCMCFFLGTGNTDSRFLCHVRFILNGSFCFVCYTLRLDSHHRNPRFMSSHNAHGLP